MHICVGKPEDIGSLTVVGFLLFKILLDQSLTQVFYTISGHGFFPFCFEKKEIFKA